MSEEEKTHPVEHSMRGDNTVYIGCDHRGCRQNYAICLNIIKAVDEKRRGGELDCTREVKSKVCPALKMRQEEQDAGHALYYRPRAVPAPVQRKAVFESKTPDHIRRSASYKNAWDRTGDIINGVKSSIPTRRSVKSAPMKIKPLKQIEKADSSDFSAAISAAIKDEIENPEPDTKKESALDRMKRIKKEKNGS